MWEFASTAVKVKFEVQFHPMEHSICFVHHHVHDLTEQKLLDFLQENSPCWRVENDRYTEKESLKYCAFLLT